MPKAEAAVAVIELVSENCQYLLIERAQDPDDPWSGHLAFPGGRYDVQDNTLLDTAIRECHEECGFSLSQSDYIKPLDLQNAGGRHHPICVAPFLFRLTRKPTIFLEQSEVINSFWVSQNELTNSGSYHYKTLANDDDTLFPYIMIGDIMLWGFTLNVLIDYLDIELNDY